MERVGNGRQSALRRVRAAVGRAASAVLDRPPLASAILAIVLYLPALGGGFVYDDYRVVLDNPALRETSRPITIALSDPTRPLLAFGFAFNWVVSGESAWSYHLVNVALHAANASLAASLFGWLAARRRSPDVGRQALLAGALFALAPMAVETVAYVASRSTAQCTLFLLLALRCSLPAIAAASPRAPRPALAWFVLALGSKEEAASLPLYLLVLDVFHGGGSLGAAVRRWRLHGPFWALPLAGLAVRRWLTGAWLPAPAYPYVDYGLTQLGAFALYWGRAILPLDPALYREHPLATWPPTGDSLAAALLGVALGGAAVGLRQRAPAFAFSVAWMASGLVPSSTLVPLSEMVVDHRAYLGAAGVHSALGAGLVRLAPTHAAAVVAAVGLRASHYVWVFRDPVRVWEDAVRRVPHSAMALLNLAQAQQRADDHAGALRSLQRGLELAPGDPRLWTNLGVTYATSGRLPEAAAAMRQALAIKPYDSRLRNNLALLLAALGRDAEARSQLEEVIRSEPSPTAKPRVDLARLLVKPSQPPAAEVARARQLVAEARRLAREWADSPEIEAVAARLRELP